MTSIVPFISGEEAGSLTNKVHADSQIVRLPLDRFGKLAGFVPKSAKVWVDPCVDGCDDIETRRSRLADKAKGVKAKKNQWFEFMTKVPHFELMGNVEFLAKPSPAKVDAFAKELLSLCAAAKPAWITVPQLPVSDGTERNKVNRALAKSAGEWKSASSFPGRLILPLIFTHQGQLGGKTSRNPKVQHAEKCYQDAQADGFWVVDKSLQDDNGSGTLRTKRFPAVISLHEELNARIPSSIRLGGPYWGLNLVLWAKGLIDYPAIGVGSGYQLFLSGGHANSPTAKIAIPSLRRRVSADPSLAKWLDQSMAKLGSSHPAYAEFDDIRKRLTFLKDPVRAREQVAVFYKHWFDQIAAIPKAGRSMALFQDLSAAYALGKSLPPFEDEGTARRPESVAEPLMMCCL